MNSGKHSYYVTGQVLTFKYESDACNGYDKDNL